MSIKIPANIKPTETVNVHNTVGNMVVATANVPAQGNYLSLVMRDGVPFDMTVSQSIEEALTAHDQYVVAMTLMDLVRKERGEDLDRLMMN